MSVDVSVVPGDLLRSSSTALDASGKAGRRRWKREWKEGWLGAATDAGEKMCCPDLVVVEQQHRNIRRSLHTVLRNKARTTHGNQQLTRVRKAGLTF